MESRQLRSSERRIGIVMGTNLRRLAFEMVVAFRFRQ